MNKLRHLTSLTILVALSSGCALFKPVDPGADKVIVNAERTINYAKETMNTFIQFEFENRALINNKEVSDAASFIGANGIQWLEDAHRLKMAYKSDRSATNLSTLNKALNVLLEAVTISQRYLISKPKAQLWTPFQSSHLAYQPYAPVSSTSRSYEPLLVRPANSPRSRTQLLQKSWLT